MRVITGTARGRRLASPKGYSTRPTTDKMKETAFNTIQFEIEGARVLDLYAGSGQMGIEALSRGASSCTFVEKGSEAFQVIQENLKVTGFLDQSKVTRMDAVTFLSTTNETYDLIYADPPFDMEGLDKILVAAEPRLSVGGVLLLESREKAILPEETKTLKKYRNYNTGQAQLTLYRKGETL